MATARTVEPRQQVSSQQVLMIVGGLVVLLVVLWFVFLRGGGEETETQVAPTPQPTVAETSEPGETGTPDDKDKGPVETFEVFAPKDPFDPLVSALGAGGGVTGGAGGTTGDGTDGTADGEQPRDGTRNGGEESIEGHRVRLIDIFDEDGRQRAQIQVDGVIFTVDEGEVFADNFQLLDLTSNCATLLFGDDQFTLCEGEEVLK